MSFPYREIISPFPQCVRCAIFIRDLKVVPKIPKSGIFNIFNGILSRFTVKTYKY